MIQAFVTGNLGRDAELRDAGRDKVCSFSVASSRKVKGEDSVTWVRCSLWGKRGESLAQYLTTGTKVAVSGELSTREYDGKTYVELRVNEIDMMGGGKGARKSRSNDTRDDYDPAAPPHGYESHAPSGGGGDDDDIPFIHCVLTESEERWWRRSAFDVVT